MRIRHALVSGVVDSGDGKVSSNAWNDDHVIVDAPFGLTPEAHDAIGDGSTDDTIAMQAAIDALPSGGTLRLTSGSTYKVTSLTASHDDLTIDATGATVTSALTTSAALLSISGARLKIVGGTWKLTAGDDDPWFFDVAGANCEFVGVRMLKTPDAGGYHAYFRYTADGAIMRNCRAEGSNGFYIEASNSAFICNTIIGRTSGGDDCFAIKGLNDSCRNVRIASNYIENLTSGLSIGSEIGVLGANDSTYSRTVGQVVFTGNILKNCYSITYIKPGAISGADYRDGTVEDVLISNNVLSDLAGTKFERGIAITAGRGARVRGIKGRNNSVRGRSAGGVGRLVGTVDIYITDDAGGTVAASVSNVDLQASFDDPYLGVANDGSHPGYPVTYGAAVQVVTYGTGTFSNIRLDVSSNGSSQSGVVVGPTSPADLDGQVELTRLRLTNANQSNTAAQGGLVLHNAVVLTDPSPVITPAFGSAYNFAAAGALTGPTLYSLGVSSGKLGYTVGGTVTQATNKSTAVTLSKLSGEITMNGAALASAAIVSFTLTNTFIAAGDRLILNHVSGGTVGAYGLNASAGAGSATIYVRNATAGSLSETIVLGFAIVRGATN